MAPTKSATTAAAASTSKTAAAEAPKLDEQGNEMNATYWIRQYVGLLFALTAMALVCFAGYAPKFPELMERGMSVNFFLYGGCATGFVGLLLHEIRPFKSTVSFTFDKEAVQARKREIIAHESKVKSAASKKQQ